VARIATAALAAGLAVAAGGLALADQLAYENARFGTRFALPAHMFTAIDPPPANSDGIRFLSDDGAALSIFGQFNVFNETPEQMRQRLAGYRAENAESVTYEAAGDDWLVLSGFSGTDIYYERYEFGRDAVVHGAVLVHPAADKARYQRLVASFAERLTGP